MSLSDGGGLLSLPWNGAPRGQSRRSPLPGLLPSGAGRLQSSAVYPLLFALAGLKVCRSIGKLSWQFHLLPLWGASDLFSDSSFYLSLPVLNAPPVLGRAGPPPVQNPGP